MRDRRDRRGRFQHPRKRETEPRERESVDVDEKAERDQRSKEARARLKEARKIGASGNRHFLGLTEQTTAQRRAGKSVQD
jgi:hypothetical protein